MSTRRQPLSVAAVIVAFLVGVGLSGLRNLGMLEGLELAVYDWWLRLRRVQAPDERVVLITVSERDIQDQNRWPLPDGLLADLLEKVGSHGPRVIGLDIYRDVPVPPGTQRLHALLKSDDRIIGVMKFGDDAQPGVPPPTVLATTDRVGFNDIIVDPGGIVRRGLLYLDDGTTTYSSITLLVVQRFLRSEGIVPRPDPEISTQLRLGSTTIRPLEADDGGYVGTDARGYQFLLDFGGPPEGFRRETLERVLSGRTDVETFKDKVVLIGITAESVKDHFYTPFSRRLTPRQQTSGVEIHAHMASQLLRFAFGQAQPLRTLADWLESLIILAAGAAGSTLGLLVRVPWRLLLAITGGVLAIGVFGYAAFLGSWWLPVVPPVLAWIGSSGIMTSLVSHHEKVERAVLMQLFSRHVSKEVAEAIWGVRHEFLEGGRLRSQRLTVTALFGDLTGFTAVAEQLAPEQLMEWLNEYMEAMAERVGQHRGVIRQYAGDSIVVLFGVPATRRTDLEIREDAKNAVECALAMQATLSEINLRFSKEARPVAGMRIGIVTGPVVAGSLGSKARSEYVAVGDTINTAARLESFDKDFLPPDPISQPCRILIGETTRAYLGEDFETEPVGQLNLKGKAEPVRVYRVIGRASTHNCSERGFE